MNLHCNHYAHAESDDSITLLAPQWESAVDFGGAKMRARIVLSLGAVRPNRGVNPACNLHADAEFVDGITLLAPQWGSAVHFGGPKIRARTALSLRVVRPKSMLNLHRNHDAHAEFDDSNYHPSASPMCLQFISGAHRFAPESRSRLELLSKHGSEFGLQSARRR